MTSYNVFVGHRNDISWATPTSLVVHLSTTRGLPDCPTDDAPLDRYVDFISLPSCKISSYIGGPLSTMTTNVVDAPEEAGLTWNKSGHKYN